MTFIRSNPGRDNSAFWYFSIFFGGGLNSLFHMSITQISGRFVDVVFGIQVSSQNLFQIHCQGAQLLVVATREQHERSCFERMFTETG